MSRIKVVGTVVELDGDEMTRVIWQFIKDRLIGFSPAIKHVGVPANNRNGGTQFVARVIHKTHLLQLCLLHLAQKLVQGNLNAGKIFVSRLNIGRINACVVNGLLKAVYFALTECS